MTSRQWIREIEDIIRGIIIVASFLVILYLLVLVLPGYIGRAAQAPDMWILRATITATELESQEGYFQIGPGVMIIVKPDSDMHQWFRSRVNQKYSIAFRPDEEIAR